MRFRNDNGQKSFDMPQCIHNNMSFLLRCLMNVESRKIPRLNIPRAGEELSGRGGNNHDTETFTDISNNKCIKVNFAV